MTIAIRPRLVVSNEEAACDAARAGIGLTRAFSYHVASSIGAGTLTTVLDEFSPDTVRTYYEAGKFHEVPPFHGEKAVKFDAPVGLVKTWSVPHSETRTLPLFFPKVKRVDVRGTWVPEIMHALQHYNELGLLENSRFVTISNAVEVNQ